MLLELCCRNRITIKLFATFCVISQSVKFLFIFNLDKCVIKYMTLNKYVSGV